MIIERNGQTITLTQEELEQAYREKLHWYRLQDAKAQFYTYIGVEPNEENVDNSNVFADAYGFNFDEAVNPDSKRFLLENIVDEFEHAFDCNRAENDMWQDACCFVLDKIASEFSSEEQDFTFEDAMADVVSYLKKKDDSFFDENDTTKKAVLEDKDLLGKIAEEHYRCVTRYGNDREWSCEDACKCEPGIC